MPNQIEKRGIEILKKKLIEIGRDVKESNNKTFDLIVDGKYAEVKTKGKSYNNLDFLSFTDKQYKEIMNGDFVIFLVLNIKDSRNVEIYEFISSDLKSLKPKLYTSYEYGKGTMDLVRHNFKKL